MRIAFVIIECKLEGGQDQYVFELINNLLVQGHDIHLYSSNVVGNFVGPVTVHRVPAPGRIGLFRFLNFFLLGTARLWLDRGSYDIIHGAGGNVLGINIATAHFCHPAWQRAMPLLPGLAVNPRRGWYDRLVTAIGGALDRLVYCSPRGPLVIAVSKSVKADMMQGYSLSDERVEVVYNGVNKERFHPRNRRVWREVVRARYSIGSDVPVLLFVGAFERKGLAFVIEALSYLPPPRPLLLVAGSGQLERHRQLAERFAVADRIVWAGQVSEVEQLYAAADIFLLPTLYEPFGLAVIEAMASGLPVITSRVAGVAEIIEHGLDGWLLDDPRDARQIAETISLLLEDPGRSKSMGERGRDKACVYDWSFVSKQTESIYHRVVMQAVEKGR